MKKFIFAALLSSMSCLALADGVQNTVDFGAHFSRNYAHAGDRNGYGFSLAKHWDKFGTEADFDRYTKSSFDQNRFSVLGTYDVVTVGPLTATAKMGVGYLDNDSAVNDGVVGLVGGGLSLKLTNDLAATVDYRYQAGEGNVNRFDGSVVNAGIKYSF